MRSTFVGQILKCLVLSLVICAWGCEQNNRESQSDSVSVQSPPADRGDPSSEDSSVAEQSSDSTQDVPFSGNWSASLGGENCEYPEGLLIKVDSREVVFRNNETGAEKFTTDDLQITYYPATDELFLKFGYSIDVHIQDYQPGEERITGTASVPGSTCDMMTFTASKI